MLPSYLNAPELQLVIEAVDHALSSARHTGMSGPGNDLVPLRWNDPVIAAILRSERHIDRLRDLLEPDDLKWLSGYLTLKAPRSPALWWHQDWWCWDHWISFVRSPTQVALLCYLTDTDAQNGALRVLPGSHHTSATLSCRGFQVHRRACPSTEFRRQASRSAHVPCTRQQFGDAGTS
jgi:hypothetical protein